MIVQTGSAREGPVDVRMDELKDVRMDELKDRQKWMMEL